MRYSWIPTIVLHLLPILSVLLTWNKPWPAALERMAVSYTHLTLPTKA